MGPVHLELKQGLKMLLHIAKDTIVDTYVAAFYHVHSSDLPQQNNLSRTLRHNATYGCRRCLIGKEYKKDLEFNIVKNKQYKGVMDAVQLKAS